MQGFPPRWGIHPEIQCDRRTNCGSQRSGNLGDKKGFGGRQEDRIEVPPLEKKESRGTENNGKRNERSTRIYMEGGTKRKER